MADGPAHQWGTLEHHNRPPARLPGGAAALIAVWRDTADGSYHRTPHRWAQPVVGAGTRVTPQGQVRGEGGAVVSFLPPAHARSGATIRPYARRTQKAMFSRVRIAIRFFFVGLAVGILLAPRSGQETRRLVRERADRLLNDVLDAATLGT